MRRMARKHHRTDEGTLLALISCTTTRFKQRWKKYTDNEFELNTLSTEELAFIGCKSKERKTRTIMSLN